MDKTLLYIIRILEWMGAYREWYENEAQTKDTIKKPPPPPPPPG